MERDPVVVDDVEAEDDFDQGGDTLPESVPPES